MNIAYVTTQLVSHDAASNNTVNVLKLLADSHTIDVFAFFFKRDAPPGVRCISYTGKNGHTLLNALHALSKIFALARTFSHYNLLFIAGPEITVLPAVHLAKLYNPALGLIWDFHGLTPARFHKGIKDRVLTVVRKYLFKISMERCDQIIVDSRYLGLEMGIKRKLKVIPIGFDLARFHNANGGEIAERYNLEGKIVLLYVGRLYSSKRVDILIKAMKKLSEDTILVVVGSGEDRDQLKKLAAFLQVDKRVIFSGDVSDEDLPKYYAVSSAFVTASLHEGFCVPIAESFASGRPVIVPDWTAMPEVAGDGGLLYDGSVEGFVKCVEIMKNHESWRRFSLRAGKIAKRFYIKKIALKYQRSVEEILGIKNIPVECE
jgi:glycosyltransferase involved in cell wall biosynthesis